MTGRQKEKFITNCVIAGIIFFFIMLFMMVYQFCLIGRYKNDERRLDNEIKKLQEQNQQTSDQIEIWMSDWKIEEKGYELGLRYPTDK